MRENINFLPEIHASILSSQLLWVPMIWLIAGNFISKQEVKSVTYFIFSKLNTRMINTITKGTLKQSKITWSGPSVDSAHERFSMSFQTFSDSFTFQVLSIKRCHLKSWKKLKAMWLSKILCRTFLFQILMKLLWKHSPPLLHVRNVELPHLLVENMENWTGCRCILR